MLVKEIPFVGGPSEGKFVHRADGIFPVRVDKRGSDLTNATGGYVFDTRRVSYRWTGTVTRIPGVVKPDLDEFIALAIVASAETGMALPRPTYVSRRFLVPRTTVRRRLTAAIAAAGFAVWTDGRNFIA